MPATCCRGVRPDANATVPAASADQRHRLLQLIKLVATDRRQYILPTCMSPALQLPRRTPGVYIHTENVAGIVSNSLGKFVEYIRATVNSSTWEVGNIDIGQSVMRSAGRKRMSVP